MPVEEAIGQARIHFATNIKPTKIDALMGLQIYWWPIQNLLIGKIISTMYVCIIHFALSLGK
jgi:hypothetical protein